MTTETETTTPAMPAAPVVPAPPAPTTRPYEDLWEVQWTDLHQLHTALLYAPTEQDASATFRAWASKQGTTINLRSLRPALIAWWGKGIVFVPPPKAGRY